MQTNKSRPGAGTAYARSNVSNHITISGALLMVVDLALITEALSEIAQAVHP